jgi:hypothetical protein
MLRFLFVPGSISDDQISVTGMIIGAIVGSCVAGLALYGARRSAAPLPARRDQAGSQ